MERPQTHSDPKLKLESAMDEYAAQLEIAATAGAASESEAALDAAASALSSVRAELYAKDGGAEEYAELQASIERQRTKS